MPPLPCTPSPAHPQTLRSVMSASVSGHSPGRPGPLAYGLPQPPARPIDRPPYPAGRMLHGWCRPWVVYHHPCRSSAREGGTLVFPLPLTPPPPYPPHHRTVLSTQVHSLLVPLHCSREGHPPSSSHPYAPPLRAAALKAERVLLATRSTRRLRRSVGGTGSVTLRKCLLLRPRGRDTLPHPPEGTLRHCPTNTHANVQPLSPTRTYPSSGFLLPPRGGPLRYAPLETRFAREFTLRSTLP